MAQATITLLSEQRRAIVAIAAGGLLALTGGLMAHFRFEQASLGIAGATVGLVMVAIGALSIRCLRCRLSLVGHAMSTHPAGAWVDHVIREHRCPRCGYSPGVRHRP